MSLQSTLERTLPAQITHGWRLLTTPVWNHETSRLRAPFRAILPLIVTFLAFAAIQTAASEQLSHPAREVATAVGLAVVLVVSVVATARFIDRRPIREYGLSVDREWGSSFVVGSAVGVLVNAGTLLVAVTAGWAEITGFATGSEALPFLPAILLVFGYIGVAATWEEFVMRGAMLKNMAEGSSNLLPRWAAVSMAVLGSSGIFALMHSGKLAHPSQAGYYLLAGLIFGTVYVLSGDLALPIGFHVFYNFSMSAVFGLGVSLQTPELIAVDIVGPAIWVGEEGLLRVLFAFVGGVLLVGYIRWRDGQFQIDDRITQWTKA